MVTEFEKIFDNDNLVGAKIYGNEYRVGDIIDPAHKEIASDFNASIHGLSIVCEWFFIAPEKEKAHSIGERLELENLEYDREPIAVVTPYMNKIHVDFLRSSWDRGEPGGIFKEGDKLDVNWRLRRQICMNFNSGDRAGGWKIGLRRRMV